MASIRKTNTKITKKLTQIENAIKRKLNSFYNRKIKPLSTLPIESIRARYESQVKALIRKTIQDAYISGTDIVTEKVSDKDPSFISFISVTDITNIQQLTEKMNDQFWTTTGKLVRREQTFEKDLATQEFEKKKSFDSEAAMIGLSALFAFNAFNTAVKSKLQTVIPIINTPIPTPIGFDVEFDIERFERADLQGKVLFLTQEDVKVDEVICEPLNRTVYDINDPDIPDPPLHRFCRCRLVPFVDEASATEFNEFA